MKLNVGDVLRRKDGSMYFIIGDDPYRPTKLSGVWFYHLHTHHLHNVPLSEEDEIIGNIYKAMISVKDKYNESR